MAPLYYACSNITSLEIALALLDEAPESTAITDKLGRTALQLLMSVAKVQNKNGMLLLHFQVATFPISYCQLPTVFDCCLCALIVLTFEMTVKYYHSNPHSSTNHCL